MYWGSVFGFCLGFGFGVGCALAVMYSIYMGGYRAAVKDGLQPIPPERLLAERSRAGNHMPKTETASPHSES